MNLDPLFQALIALITVGTAIFGVMKFLLKDIMTKLSLMDQHILEIKQNQSKFDKQILECNKRMDGVYHILIKRLKRPKTNP